METEGGGVDNRPPIDDDHLPVEAMDTQEGLFKFICYFFITNVVLLQMSFFSKSYVIF